MSHFSLEVTRLFVYPVKSLRGIELSTAELTPLGFKNDRRFMIVRSNGRFVTQRDNALLALVETSMDGGQLQLSRAGGGAIRIPDAAPDAEIIRTRVWNDDCEAVDHGNEIGSWLTAALESQTPLRLVSMRSGFQRSLYKKSLMGESTSTIFADAAPYLVVNQASLDALNVELENRDLDAVPINRFRPNIVVRGLDAFEEHRLSRLQGDSFSLSCHYPCERCVVTTIDQETAVRDPDMQPHRTLTDLNPMPDNPKAPAFGENVTLTSGAGRFISVGDRLQAAAGD